MAEPGAREAKLIQYLNEAYGKEKELETALQAHIAMTTRAPYKKRLQEHLRETKRHGREVERRIKKLGGQASGAASVVAEVATKAAATAKGPLHALRGTGEEEKMLKNAKTEYWNEHEEIATYTAIETLAQAVGDTDSAKLARDIRREEERMAKFLERQIPVLTKAVAKAEIPASERRANGARRTSRSRSSASRASTASSRSGSTASRSRSSSSRSRSSGGGRSRSSRSTA
jgi:ferritin-like metal-binding protein YciE